MDEKFKKPYDPAETESRLYKAWEESGYFNPDNLPNATKGTFTIMMPPPNATGVLHMGHMLGCTIQDVMIRFRRLQGYEALFLPGTDHAAIATQARVEKDISKNEGKSRHDLGREELVRRIDEFVEGSRDTIRKQIRATGASCDWSREAFTFDEARNRAVNRMFKDMYDAGLIYKGLRIVNWDPKGQTTISDDEIVYEDEKTKFYYFKYGPFTIGTARPETKFGDKHVVMHPDDPRYKEYKHGDTLTVEWINGPIEATIIKDASVDPEFGTGVMTITPSHSQVDFEIAERHGLGSTQIIDLYGKLLPIADEFAGMKIKDAREKIVEKLAAKGLVDKIDENYQHRIATAERTGGIIEPQILNQWFIDVNKPIKERGNKSLKELMLEPVRSGAISILPDHYDKTYYHWIENLRDWCISRQIWYGHRVPVWTRGEETMVGDAPSGDWKADGWTQDEDTLDTWFSSGSWTFSTLGWPDETPDLARFHPTDVLETAYEILFFWVARMILMSQFVLGEIPFKTVYLHGLVRDAQGRKFSKSLGNGIDPIEIINKFGADAARISLVIGNTPGTDMKLSEDRIKGYKHFANKLWNITRFILENTEGADLNAPLMENDMALKAALAEIAADVTKDMEAYRLYLAADKLYQYAWSELAANIIEESKPILAGDNPEAVASRKATLRHLLKDLLILLHPFMPFVTEEIWQSIPETEGMLMVAQWPN
ncbi:MAG: valine--tRNA ligase [Parcubacteria bacterium C7867-008]|nr:MAG: valine--tRNA ligase [Parcubacteria bacterium C7867-008]